MGRIQQQAGELADSGLMCEAVIGREDLWAPYEQRDYWIKGQVDNDITVAGSQ